MKKAEVKNILSYEAFFFAHKLGEGSPGVHTIPVSFTKIVDRTAKHFRERFDLNDLETTTLRHCILQAYLMGRKEKRRS